ncbi:dUTP diphosphatase [Lysinibacillus sp. M3]|uniref:dUTP diphosphatase n=1 Tax=Lysinibacillus zambalensis TaxID=3160866 RepID=A0ABV1MYZ1_9BACI
MNLTKLFETQAVLDEHIIQEHPELRGQNNLDWKLLALQVELGECANEWRGFKKWSKDQEPRTRVACQPCNGSGLLSFVVKKTCRFCNGSGTVGNPLLEEYVDCLHFILSIGLEIDVETSLVWDDIDFFDTDITVQFIGVASTISQLRNWKSRGSWEGLFSKFYILGKMLGFTWEQVEEAYYAKNKVNHERQNTGY